ncbi:LuxR C-terminal-related transcriptional regulator [Roseibium salinum]|uniref:LuxR C-terminal-related transcriptional regulator n=1 Tax=Roseibium salinum TaxID=1604349 RepID=A0ABT3QZ24_9HYPH|nr:LuxR C-terminal-related transcriptional regulator [Roseibium sp. DSM 29163]MCX2722090.1 LuxR C-terminal-related transcriptional regulator [Roseibium sp. DSM 29163]MDN3719891.1 LuxR C-terminal-related transcriptional regulator [Roseibium salinum]
MEDLAVLAFDNAPVGLVFSENRIIRRCNPRIAEMFGYPLDELRDASLSVLYPSSDEFVRIGQAGAERMAGSGRYRDERIMRRRCGELFWCRVRGQSLDPAAPFARAVWSFADISEDRPIAEMSRRERQVARLLAEGHTSKEIARALEISPRTVEVHRARLMKKFSARNSLELIAHIAGIPL